MRPTRSTAALVFAVVVATIAPATPRATQAAIAPSAQARIVSLIPSLTEDLFAIGAGPDVVGVSQFTDVPREAARLPAVASFATVDAEAIVRLHPTLVVAIPAQAPLVRDLARAGIVVHLLRNDSYDDIFVVLRRLGALTGRARAAAALERRLRARTARIVRDVPRDAPRPRTFVVLGVAPIFTVGRGSYIAQLLELAGGTDAAAIREPYARYDAEALVAAQPDAIVADRTSGFAAVRDRPPWSALRAVRDGRAYVLGDADILERPGPRYNDGLAWLVARMRDARRR